MAIPDSTLNPARPTSVPAAQPANPRARGETADGDNTLRPGEAVRQQTNAMILRASLEVSIRAGNDAQTLLFQSAIENINELLADEFGADAIQYAAANQDNSPEATAGRILDLSLGFFDAYAAQRPNDDPDTVASDFVALVRGGFEQGFNEAREILESLKVFGGEIQEGIMKTWDLVQQGYDDFLASRLSEAAGPKAVDTAGDTGNATAATRG